MRRIISALDIRAPIDRSIIVTAPGRPPMRVERRPDVASEELPRRRPISGDGWELHEETSEWTRWINLRHGLCVLSSVQEIKGDLEGPQWHVSVSVLARTGPQVASDEAVALVRSDFDMIAAEEDNHVPHGKVRNLWLPVNRSLQGVDCPCKADEEPHREGAYEWRDVP